MGERGRREILIFTLDVVDEEGDQQIRSLQFEETVEKIFAAERGNAHFGVFPGKELGNEYGRMEKSALEQLLDGLEMLRSDLPEPERVQRSAACDAVGHRQEPLEIDRVLSEPA